MNGSVQRTNTIVVGVDGSPDADRALQWAIDEAKRHSMKVVLVHGVEIGVALTDFEGVVSGVARYTGGIALLGDGDGRET